MAPAAYVSSGTISAGALIITNNHNGRRPVFSPDAPNKSWCFFVCRNAQLWIRWSRQAKESARRDESIWAVCLANGPLAWQWRQHVLIGRPDLVSFPSCKWQTQRNLGGWNGLGCGLLQTLSIWMAACHKACSYEIWKYDTKLRAKFAYDFMSFGWWNYCTLPPFHFWWKYTSSSLTLREPRAEMKDYISQLPVTNGCTVPARR